MDTLAEAKAKILTEITTADSEVIASFLNRYDGQVAQFSELMAQTMIAWHELASAAEKHEKVNYVA